MTAAGNKKLTKAAKRDLADLAAGKDIVPCYGPWIQLRDAGYATGTQWNPILTAEGRARAQRGS